MMLVVLQLTAVLISVVVLFDVDFAVLPDWTNGKIGQMLHFFHAWDISS